jgi:hypothetical protein
MARDPAARSTGSTLDERRILFVQQVRLRHPLGTEELLTLDLGLGGVFVERPQPLPVGQEVEVRFHLPGNTLPVEATCRVAWWRAAQGPLPRRQPSGLGLEFVILEAKDRDRIRRLLEEHGRLEPRMRRFARPWPRVPGE